MFALLQEGQSIQDHLKPLWSSHVRKDCSALTFAKLVILGKIRAAIRLLDGSSSGGILNPSDIYEGTGMPVRDCLAAKHPAAQPIVPSEVVPPPADSDSSHPVIYDSLTGALVKSVAMSVNGAACPSWADAAD